MSITACPKCGGRRIFQGRLKDGVITGYNSRDVCRDCGYQGSPIIFDNIDEYHKFELEKKSNKTLDEIPDDKKLDDEIVLSEKDKEVVDFLKELGEVPTPEIKIKSVLLKSIIMLFVVLIFSFIIALFYVPFEFFLPVVLVIITLFIIFLFRYRIQKN